MHLNNNVLISSSSLFIVTDRSVLSNMRRHFIIPVIDYIASVDLQSLKPLKEFLTQTCLDVCIAGLGQQEYEMGLPIWPKAYITVDVI